MHIINQRRIHHEIERSKNIWNIVVFIQVHNCVIVLINILMLFERRGIISLLTQFEEGTEEPAPQGKRGGANRPAVANPFAN